MKFFLSSLRKLDTPLEIKSGQTASKDEAQLLKSWSKNSRALNKYAKKSIPGISLSLYASLLTIGTSIGIGITFNPQRSLADSSTCVGVFSTNTGGTLGFLNEINNNSYTTIFNYGGTSTNINGAAVQPSTGNIYFVDRNSGQLVYYNTAINTTTPVAITGTGIPAAATLVGATFNSAGELFLFYGSSRQIARVNPSTGALIGNVLNISGFPATGALNGDIAIAPDGQMYAIGDPGTAPRLYKLTINATSGSVDAGIAITGVSGAINGLAIDSINGRFFVSTGSGTFRLNTSVTPHTVAASSTNPATDLAACGTPVPNKPTITKQFSPSNVIGLPATSTLSISLGNDNLVPIYLTQSLTDVLPSGLVVATPNSLSTTCTDALSSPTSPVTATAGGSSVILSNGAKIPVGGCTISVNVRANSPGTYINTIAAGDLKTITGNNVDPTTSSLVVPSIDYSDAPITGTAPNGTGTNSYGIAIHAVVAGIRLGATVDAETTSIANATASGDGTDDDGINSFPTLTAGVTSYSIPAANITATGTGTLHAWIDFNKNGTFDVGEYTSVAVTNNTITGALDWTGITVGTTGNTFARFRFTSDTNITASTPSGTAINGEVEDYQVSIAAASASLTCGTIYGSFNNAGTFNGLRSYDPLNGNIAAQIATLTTTGGTTPTVAALAVDPILDNNGNRRVYYMENTGAGAKLFYYSGSSITDTGIALTVPYSPLTTIRSDGSTGSINNSFNRMGFAPDGTLYIADGQKTFYRFSPNRSGTDGSLSAAVTIIDNANNDIGNFGRAQIGQSGGGDIAFDNAGRMYIVTYDSNNSNVPTEFRLFQVINPQSSNPTAVLLGREASTDPVAGLAFRANDNTLYMQGSGGKTFGWNLGTNVVTSLPLATPGSADLGSCTYPNLSPTVTFTKTVANITNPGANLLSNNDILEYTLNVTNNGSLVAGNATLTDPIPAGTTYVAGSTKLNGTAKADNAGAMPYADPVNLQPVNSPGEASGVLTTGITRKATVVFRVKVTATNTKICNQSSVFYDGGLPVGIFSDDPTTTTVADDQTCAGVNKAQLVLVKRITAIKRNGEIVPENFTAFVDDSSSTTSTSDDNHCNWPGATGAAGSCTNNYTVGRTFLADVQPGDEIEYTIYYLNGGGNSAKQVRVCDQLDANLTFQTQFDSSDATTVGKGLMLSEGIIAPQYLTNTGVDSDRGQLTTPVLATSCNLAARVGSNLSNDVVVVDVGTKANPLTNSSNAGTPTTSYGYIRFKAKVK
jgi:uncharacterized repeat protein (TIGR01451 family)